MERLKNLKNLKSVQTVGQKLAMVGGSSQTKLLEKRLSNATSQKNMMIGVSLISWALTFAAVKRARSAGKTVEEYAKTLQSLHDEMKTTEETVEKIEKQIVLANSKGGGNNERVKFLEKLLQDQKVMQEKLSRESIKAKQEAERQKSLLELELTAQKKENKKLQSKVGTGGGWTPTNEFHQLREKHDKVIQEKTQEIQKLMNLLNKYDNDDGHISTPWQTVTGQTRRRNPPLKVSKNPYDMLDE